MSGMSLPAGFLGELRNRIQLSAVIGRKVTWDMRRSNMAKGDWWAPCPFHQEKSASFHVDDRKGFYYCFGCHAKGDVLTFIRESENLDFIEAVRVLAAEAGMKMPERDPHASEKADRRCDLASLMEEIVQFYRLQLNTSAASAARDYLSGRCLGDEARQRWELGWAPRDGQSLIEALKRKGVPADMMLATGMIAKGDDGSLYDRFRSRIIFPIRDGRGRAISLGGRSLDPAARAKYLNGPETDLFDKGRNLFNLHRAREAAGRGQNLIVAEGYMDVIALSEAGFTASVAPLGTAVTEEQLQSLWRVADEPIISLDGDAAGIHAALRVVDLALPLITAGKGLRFALLPSGKDPDDLIRIEGPAAMQQVLDSALPMVDLLWRRETEGKTFDSPERRAALDRSLRQIIGRITDRSLRRHYGEAIRDRRWKLFHPAAAPRPRGPNRAYSRRNAAPSLPAATTRQSLLAGALDPGDLLREAVILAALFRYPLLVARFEAALEHLDLSSEDHRLLRTLLLRHGGEPGCHATMRTAAPGPLDRLMDHPHVRISPALKSGADDAFAALCIEEALARLEADRAHRLEMSEAELDMDGFVDEGLTWRISKAAEERDRARHGPAEEATETFLAANGVSLDRSEVRRARELLDSIDYTRKRGDRR